MQKQILLPVLLLTAMQSIAQSGTVVIKGKFNGDPKGTKQVYIYGNNVKTDSAAMDAEGNFQFTLPFEKPFTPVFYTEYDRAVSRMYQPFPVLVDRPGTVILKDGDIAKGMSSFKVTGLQSAVDFSELRIQQNEVYKKVNKKIGEKYGDKWYDRKSANGEAAAKEQGELIGQEMAGVLASFIKTHPDSYASGLALSQARSSLKPEEIQKLYNMLSAKGKQTEEAKNAADYLKGLKNSAIGAKVSDFTLNTPQEAPLSFASLKGKYVLVDFWASWCGPCKASFPHMKEVYRKYKSDKFEIYGISIDKDKAAWLKGVEDQQLPWLSTLDTKNIAQSGFAVTAVPTTFLIDPQGKIIMKEVGFETDGSSPLEKKLVELFGTK